MFSDKELRVLDVLYFEAIVPKDGLFQITEKHLKEFVSLYGNIFSPTKSVNTKSKSNYRYARKLAGLTLLKLNFSRGAKFKDMLSGLVYIIENNVFPEHYKIGMTIDIQDRLASYQTYDPYKGFKIIKYEFVLDRKHSETKLLNHPDIFIESGEWVSRNNAVALFEQIVYSEVAQLVE